MGSGQMLQTLGALVLLSLLVLNANRTVLNNSRIVYTGQYTETALSLAESYLQEITAKAFDEKAIGQPSIKDPSKFSWTLGPDYGETSAGSFDDVDDYIGYPLRLREPVVSDTTTLFKLECAVDYMTDDLSATSAIPTFYKRITVTISVPFADPGLFGQEEHSTPLLRLARIVSYH